jgi:FtsH-binding integral membrane protein
LELKMNEFNRANTSARATDQAYIDEGLRAHMLRIYNYMTAALSLTGIVAWFGASSGLYQSLAASPLIYVIMFAPLGVVFYFASKINTMSSSKAQSVFWVFAGLMGLSLSYIFLAYTGAAVFQAFFVTAGAFAGLSIWGYTTKRDLSAMGAFFNYGFVWLNNCFSSKSICWQWANVFYYKRLRSSYFRRSYCMGYSKIEA